MPLYFIASFLPVLLLVPALLLGGAWPFAALIYITVIVVMADRIPVENAAVPGHQRSAALLSRALAVAHFALLGLGVAALAGDQLTLTDKVAGLAALALFFGQISNSNAHELIHRPGRVDHLLGMLVYASLLFGHHVSAHLRVHHRFAATTRDPNTARKGEGFYSYAFRAWLGSYAEGKLAEDALRLRKVPAPSVVSHPYLHHAAVSSLTIWAAFALAGPAGIAVLLGLSLLAQLQLLLSDYVQHYGLQRQIMPDGRPVPMGPQHAWNAPQWYSSAMMLNAPLHSDHHLHPDRAFPALSGQGALMPVLPFSLPVMAASALIPPLWRWLMDARADAWWDVRAPSLDAASDMPPPA